jgi:hypothetical protein
MTDEIAARASTVTESALFRRVARRVLRDGLILARCRYESRWFNDLGGTTPTAPTISRQATHIDLEAIAAEVHALRLGEAVLERE